MLRYFDQCIFCKVHSIGPINMCTNFEMNRYKIDTFRKHATIVCLLTSRDAKTVRWMVLIGIFISNILQPTRNLNDFRFKSYGSSSGFN